MLSCVVTMFAQNDRISYQAVVRDSTNHLVVETPLTVKVTLTDADNHPYSENHSVTSNPNGLISLWIGDGYDATGNWNLLKWNSVTVESKIFRQSDGVLIAEHTLPLAAVPYSLYSENVNKENLTTNINEYFEEHPFKQVQSDWGEIDPMSDAYILRKPEIPVVNDGKLTIKLDNQSYDFTANQSGDKTVDIDAVIQRLLAKIDSLKTIIDNLKDRVETLEEAGGEFVCGTSKVKDIEGNQYETVEIDSQCWMKTNLRTKKFKNGNSIDLCDSLNGENAYYYVVKNSLDVVQDDSICGYLYNWKAASQEICPSGWHLPTPDDWSTLTNYLLNVDSMKCSSNVEYLAKALASAEGWDVVADTANYPFPCEVGYHQSTKNNATGFSAYPAGKMIFPVANYFGQEAHFWLNDCSCRYLRYSVEKILATDPAAVESAYSIRCLRD